VCRSWWVGLQCLRQGIDLVRDQQKGHSVKRRIWVAGVLTGIVLASPAFAVSITDSNFNQVARVQSLGGTVTFLGSAPGTVTTTSGVSVTLPGWVFPSFDEFSSGGSSEPGNLLQYMFGAPTDLTYTAPGLGGPDGGSGDGSVQLLANGFVTLRFAQPVVTPTATTADLFFFTDTAGGGTALIQILGLGDAVLDSLTTIVPAGSPGTGMGGLLLDLPDGLTYSAVRVTVQSGSVEFDALGARTAVPEPATLVLLGSALVGMGAANWRRRANKRM